MCCRRLKHQFAGYTLLEILLVLVVIGVLASLLLPSLDGPMANYRLRQTAGEFRARLFNARLRAMETATPHAVMYTPGSDRYSVLSIDDDLVMRLDRSAERRFQFLAPASTGRSRRAIALTQQMRIPTTDAASLAAVFSADGTAGWDTEVRIRDRRTGSVAVVGVNAMTGAAVVADQR